MHTTTPGEGVTLSKEQTDAIDAIVASPKRVTVLTGQAGSGKSTVTNALIQQFGWVACATTGKAAMHINGPTVDLLFCLNRERWNIWSEDYLYRNMLELPDTIIIDEGSMIGEKMGDLIHNIVTRKEFNKRLLIVGDWAQAAPVADGPILESLLMSDYEFIKLWENHRQGEGEFLGILNEIRMGTVSEAGDRLMRDRLCPTPPDDDRYIRMYATNRKTNTYNNARLYRHVAEEKAPLFTAYARFQDMRREETQKRNPRDEKFKMRAIESSPFSHGQALAPGCRVLLTLNSHPFFVNGDTGTLVDAYAFDGRNLARCVEDYERNQQNFRIQSIRVLLDRTGQTVDVLYTTREVRDPTGRFVQHTVSGFPVKLGYACTIHKAQGMTVDKAWVDIDSLDNFPDDQSRHGLAYVALSRTRTLDGLLLGSWDPKLVYCNPNIRELL